MPHRKHARAPKAEAQPEQGTNRQMWLWGLCLVELVLFGLIVITQSTRREGFIIVFSLVAGCFTLFLLFKPVFKDWGGFADSFKQKPKIMSDDFLAPDSDVWTFVPKLPGWLLLGIGAAVGVYILVHALR